MFNRTELRAGVTVGIEFILVTSFPANSFVPDLAQISNLDGVCIDVIKPNGFFFVKQKPFQQAVAENHFFFTNSEKSSDLFELCSPFFFSGSSRLHFY